MAALPVVMMAGSLNLGDIVKAQSGTVLWIIPNWYVWNRAGVHAVLHRGAHRDRADAVRHGRGRVRTRRRFRDGVRVDEFGLLFLSEFSNTFIFAALLVTLFFGGWQLPWVPASALSAMLASAAGRVRDQDLHRDLLPDGHPRNASPRARRPDARARLEVPAARRRLRGCWSPACSSRSRRSGRWVDEPHLRHRHSQEHGASRSGTSSARPSPCSTRTRRWSCRSARAGRSRPTFDDDGQPQVPRVPGVRARVPGLRPRARGRRPTLRPRQAHRPSSPTRSARACSAACASSRARSTRSR